MRRHAPRTATADKRRTCTRRRFRAEKPGWEQNQVRDRGPSVALRVPNGISAETGRLIAQLARESEMSISEVAADGEFVRAAFRRPRRERIAKQPVGSDLDPSARSEMLAAIPHLRAFA